MRRALLLPEPFGELSWIRPPKNRPSQGEAQPDSGLLITLSWLCAAGLALGVATLLPASVWSLSEDMRTTGVLSGAGSDLR